MKRLFVFAIGGTGSRVLKSLAMLLAAGVRHDGNNVYEIVPIIIDPHKANDDLKRTLSILGAYEKIAEHGRGDGKGFFGTRVRTLDRIGTTAQTSSSTFSFQLQQVSNSRFADYIDYTQMSESNRALTELLFSGNSIDNRGQKVPLLDIEMDIGFVGNPNVGSVVLNQFAESKEFKDFAANFNDGDRVFIISSIFGGTGAAGFPVILKNLRDALRQNLDARSFVQNARIGAITVMPYFNIESDPDSPIRKSDFISKTKAALYYYQNNVTGNNSLNALYYIADHYHGKPYKNDPGAGGQRNDAHFVELASALSIIDFMGIPDKQLETVNGKAIDPIYREFSIRNSHETLAFSDLADETERKLVAPLSKLFLTYEYLVDPRTIENMRSDEPWTKDAPSFDAQFLNSIFYRSHFLEFRNHFMQWLHELARNRRGFKPFEFGNLDYPIVGRPPKKSLFKFKSFNHDQFTGALNTESKSAPYPSAEAKLLGLFGSATSNILANYFDIKDANDG